MSKRFTPAAFNSENPDAHFDSIIEHLNEGYERFQRYLDTDGDLEDKKGLLRPKRYESRQAREKLANGHSPYILILRCMDARLLLTRQFDLDANEALTIANGGNNVNTRNVDELEFVHDHFGVRLFVIAGHEKCGAMKAKIEHCCDHHERTSGGNSNEKFSADNISLLGDMAYFKELSDKLQSMLVDFPDQVHLHQRLSRTIKNEFIDHLNQKYVVADLDHTPEHPTHPFQFVDNLIPPSSETITSYNSTKNLDPTLYLRESAENVLYQVQRLCIRSTKIRRKILSGDVRILPLLVTLDGRSQKLPGQAVIEIASAVERENIHPQPFPIIRESIQSQHIKGSRFACGSEHLGPHAPQQRTRNQLTLFREQQH